MFFIMPPVPLNTHTDFVKNKNNFLEVGNYIEFARRFSEYIELHRQGVIVSQNENCYRFYQFGEEARFAISRPYNMDLLFSHEDFERAWPQFVEILDNLSSDYIAAPEIRQIINRTIYSMQQYIGFALDACGDSNAARKINGDLFERLIVKSLQKIGIDCHGGVVKVPVVVNGQREFDMNYQHDLIIDGEIHPKLIGSIKTTSKDRIDKIFMDKFLYSRLTETQVPHIAIFLHDVQRKKYSQENRFGVSTTFLPGHFKGYTVKLNALDGVYYFDPRPIMSRDALLREHIFTFDKLLCDDIWQYT